MPGRSITDESYRYGFQGQEQDNEVKGQGNSVNYKFRMHDSRLGRFFAVDPLSPQYAFYSPYSFSGNRVLDAVEIEGLEPKVFNNSSVWNLAEKTGVAEGENFIFKVDNVWVLETVDVENFNMIHHFWYDEESRVWNSFFPVEENDDPLAKILVAELKHRGRSWGEIVFANNYPNLVPSVGLIMKDATNRSDDSTSQAESGEGSKRNALRHAYGLAAASKRFGDEIASELGDAHEDGLSDVLSTYNEARDLVLSGQIAVVPLIDADSFVDQLNNQVGITIGSNSNLSNNEIWQKIIEAYDAGKLYEYRVTDDGANAVIIKSNSDPIEK